MRSPPSFTGATTSTSNPRRAPGGAEHLGGGLALAAEAEVVAHDHDAGPALARQKLRERLGAKVTQSLIEAQHAQVIERQPREQPPALAQAGEARRWVLRLQEFSRQGLEGHQHGRQPRRRGPRCEAREEPLVTQVQPVVGANSQGAARGRGLRSRRVRE